MSIASQPVHQQLYDADFALWIDEAVDLLKQGRFEALDLENLIEEIESLGSRDERELQSRLSVLVMHLLKWQHQTHKRTNSWIGTIAEQRKQIGLIIEDSPSLKPFFEAVLEKEYSKQCLRRNILPHVNKRPVKLT